MNPTHTVQAQGRSLSFSDLSRLQTLIDEHPDWSRHRVAQELCLQWQWRTALGQLKTFAARSLLLTLAGRGQLRLPRLREQFRRVPWGLGRAKDSQPAVAPPPRGITDWLERLRPLRWQLARHGSPQRAQALACLRQYHYLGCNRPVGAHLLYLVQDAQGRDLAVHLVGAAAWQCAARDRFIGWSQAARQAGLHLIANHSRFLILPWVRVPHLASHLLAGLVRRVSCDWLREHGWRLHLLESFVQADRFAGTAYRAANWQEVGLTSGRTRQEKAHRAQAPRKRVWVYRLGPSLGLAMTAPTGRRP